MKTLQPITKRFANMNLDTVEIRNRMIELNSQSSLTCGFASDYYTITFNGNPETIETIRAEFFPMDSGINL